jgi:hypothetical protein
MSCLGLWAGEKIVCVGDDIDAGDYPPGLFTKDEEDELSQITDECGDPFTLYDFQSFDDEEY